MLWNDSHETFKEFLARCFNNSTAKAGITKEAAVDNFVAIHNGHGAASKTGLHFNPASVTEANRLKANCATFWRYFDKEELFEMLPYILGSMGEEQRMAFLSQYLRPAGVGVRLLDDESEADFTFEHAAETQHAAFGALDAITRAALNPTLENLDLAEREADKANEKFVRTRRLLSALRNGAAKAKAGINKALHRKAAV